MTENGSLRFVVGLKALASGYDANGNMTLRLKDGARYFLAYDAENRLTSVSGTVSASFAYNGDGQRVTATIGATITTYIGGYFEWQGGAGTSYYFAGAQRIAMRTSTDVKYLLGDHLGSTSVTALASGAFDTETRYYPWGGVRWASGTTPTDYRFTDQQEIATIGLYFYNSRFYDAALGRFVSPDIIIPNPGDPVSFDRFGYVRNNPLKYVDPSGYKYYCGSQGSQYDPEECDFEPLNPMSIDKSALNPGGLEAFNTLSYLASLDSEWWGKGLTAQEAIAMVLLLEASVGLERVQSGYWAMNSDVIEAITRQYNEHCGSGSWSAGCFNGFWAYYEPLINGSRLGEVQANNLYNFTDSRTNTNYGNVYMRTAGLVASKTSIGGEYPDNPAHWVTLSLSKNPLTYAEVLLRVEAGSYPFFSFMEGSDKIFIVLSANLATELCGDTNCTDAP